MARSITLILGNGLGTNLGPNFNLTSDAGAVTPSTATRSELLAGKIVSVNDATTSVTVTSTGPCTNSITQSLPCPPLTTTTTTTAAPTDFVSTWETTNTSVGSSNSDQVKLPLQSSGTYNFTVNWGDDNTDTITTWNQAETTHTYASSGDWIITITGTCSGFAFLNTGDRQKLLSITSFGSVNFGNNLGIFYGCTNLNLSAVTDTPNLSAMNSLQSMFRGCTSLTTINNVNSWNTSTIINMSFAFQLATNFNQSLNSWNVTNVVNMASMFQNATSFNGDISNWNVSSVQNMAQMFNVASVFNQNIGGWVVSAVTTMQSMFAFATAFNQNIGGWDVGNVTDMGGMLAVAEAFNQNINGWDVGNVVSMSSMFNAAYSFNQSLNSWDVSNVEFMQSMFNENGIFNGNITSWDVSSVTNMQSMFRLASAFNQNIGNWNISNVGNFTDFMLGKNTSTYSSTNLDAIYNGWSSRSVQPNLTITFGTAEYTSAGQTGKNILTGAPNNWTITDGGI